MALVAGGSKSIGDETRELPNLQKFMSHLWYDYSGLLFPKIIKNKIQANLTVKDHINNTIKFIAMQKALTIII